MTHDVISQLEPQHTTARIDSIESTASMFDEIGRSTNSTNSSSRLELSSFFSIIFQ